MTLQEVSPQQAVAPSGTAADCSVVGGAWTAVCRVDDLLAGRGACALVQGDQVAVFRLADGADGAPVVHAIGNVDPFAGASVLSRGIVGVTRLDGIEVAYVASPLRKHRFVLATGASLDDPEVSAGSWPVRCEDGMVLVACDPHSRITAT